MFNDWLLFLPALLIAITVHEFSHAAMADYLGDPNPRLAGRLSLNPLKHLDPIGTLMLLFFHFGWGKPVVVETSNLRHPKRDHALISLAGPASNLILASLLAIILRIFIGNWVLEIGNFFVVLILMNINLAIFNLLPIPPLDGAKIIYGLLPMGWADEYEDFMHSYGTVLLILLILPIGGSSLAIKLIMPVIRAITGLLL